MHVVVMLTRERNLEQTLLDFIDEPLEKLSVSVTSVLHNQATSVIDIRLRLPEWADRYLRHEVLDALGKFEREIEHAVVINPTFVWGRETGDE